MLSLKFSIDFRIHYESKWGENLVVTGNIKELGNWDPFKGLRLNWGQVRIIAYLEPLLD